MANDGQQSDEKTNISFSLSTLFIAQELSDEERRKKSAREVQQELFANLRKIRENIPRSREISETVLDETKGGPCEKLLPARDENGKLFTDYELRMKVRMNLDDLTSWLAVKEAFCSGMENPKKLERCHKMAEKLHFIEEEDEEVEDDEDENEVGFSTRSNFVDSLFGGDNERKQPITSGDDEDGEAGSRESISVSPQQKNEYRKKGLNKIFSNRRKKNVEKKSSEDELDDALLEAAAARKKSDIELLVQARRSLDVERLSSNSAASSGELQQPPPFFKRSSTTSANGININIVDKTVINEKIRKSISGQQKMADLSAKNNHQLQRSKTTTSPNGIDIVRKTLLIFNDDSSKSGKLVKKQKQAKRKMDKLHNGQKNENETEDRSRNLLTEPSNAKSKQQIVPTKEELTENNDKRSSSSSTRNRWPNNFFKGRNSSDSINTKPKHIPNENETEDRSRNLLTAPQKAKSKQQIKPNNDNGSSSNRWPNTFIKGRKSSEVTNIVKPKHIPDENGTEDRSRNLLIAPAKSKSMQQLVPTKEASLTQNNDSGSSSNRWPYKIFKGRHSLDAKRPELTLNDRLNGMQRYAKLRNRNGLSMVQRSSSTGAKMFVKEQKLPVCNARWEIIRHGLYILNDDHLKENFLRRFRRVNCALQLIILQHAMLETKYYQFCNVYSNENCIKIIKTRETVLSRYQECFLKEKEQLTKMIERLFAEQLGDQFAKALVELRDKVIAHWSWLYEQDVQKF
ncbi:hypothetical protein niasHT_023315 [Heterodera trifolii]|uniref:Uncharacterized protein n=1 Tax=Heterodera trifolii TaxID=157864 RepID=A0ABD2JDP3_9BILA